MITPMLWYSSQGGKEVIEGPPEDPPLYLPLDLAIDHVRDIYHLILSKCPPCKYPTVDTLPLVRPRSILSSTNKGMSYDGYEVTLVLPVGTYYLVVKYTYRNPWGCYHCSAVIESKPNGIYYRSPVLSVVNIYGVGSLLAVVELMVDTIAKHYLQCAECYYSDGDSLHCGMGEEMYTDTCTKGRPFSHV